MDYQETNQEAGSATPGSTGTAKGAAGAVKQEVQRLATETRQGAAQVVDRARDAVTGTAEGKKDEAAQRLDDIASSLRGAGGQLGEGDLAFFGRYAGVAADELQRLSTWLRNRDMRDLVRDTETFARRHPDLFIGASFVAGLAIARFLKSSTPEETALEPSPMTTSAPVMADEVRSFAPQPAGGLRTEGTFGYASPGTSAYDTAPAGGSTAGFSHTERSSFGAGDRTGAMADLNVPEGPNGRNESIGASNRTGTTGYGPSGLGQSPSTPRSGEGGTTGETRRDDEEGGF